MRSHFFPTKKEIQFYLLQRFFVTRNIIFHIHKYIFENPHIALARSFLLLRQSNKINKVENNPSDEIFFAIKSDN